MPRLVAVPVMLARDVSWLEHLRAAGSAATVRVFGAGACRLAASVRLGAGAPLQAAAPPHLVGGPRLLLCEWRAASLLAGAWVPGGGGGALLAGPSCAALDWQGRAAGGLC
jgi:hypothetical protein